MNAYVASQGRSIRRMFEPGLWELVRARPHASLAAYVREYVGCYENVLSPVRRREMPGDLAPVILHLTGRTRIFDAKDPARSRDHTSFASGAWDTHVVVGASASYTCLQINFTILGARMFLGVPLHELTNRVVALDEICDRQTADLAARLHDAPTWNERFALLDREISARVEKTRAPARTVQWTWSQLAQTHGRVQIATLAREARVSGKHLIALVRSELGLTPKVLARVLRFGRAVELLRNPATTSLADVAYACGYYDQAHFAHDFRELAGVTPGTLISNRQPESGSFAA